MVLLQLMVFSKSFNHLDNNCLSILFLRPSFYFTYQFICFCACARLCSCLCGGGCVMSIQRPERIIRWPLSLCVFLFEAGSCPKPEAQVFLMRTEPRKPPVVLLSLPSWELRGTKLFALVLGSELQSSALHGNHS